MLPGPAQKLLISAAQHDVNPTVRTSLEVVVHVLLRQTHFRAQPEKQQQPLFGSIFGTRIGS